MGFSTSRLKPQSSALPWRERSPLSSLVLVSMEQEPGDIAEKTGDEQDAPRHAQPRGSKGSVVAPGICPSAPCPCFLGSRGKQVSRVCEHQSHRS